MNKYMLSNKDIYKHILKYSQYSEKKSWAKWYTKVSPLKSKRVAEVLLNYKNKNSKVLDLGCGIGLTLVGLAEVYPNCIGCDISDKEIYATKEILRKVKKNIPVIKYDEKKLPFPDNSFDIVTSIEVIEHVNNPILYLKEAKRVLKKDGILHITTANKFWPIEPHFKLPFLSYLPSNYADFYVRLFKRGMGYQDIHLPTYAQFRNMVGKYFKVEDITFTIVRDYKKYNFDKERGEIIKILGVVLKFLNRFEKNKHLSFFSIFIKNIMINLSLGWLFICYPKK